MMYGIIYEYVDQLTGRSAYVGKAAGLYGFKKTLQVVHRRHMRGVLPIPFDRVLREDESRFELQIIDRRVDETGTIVQMALKPLEKVRIRERQPKYNQVRMRAGSLRTVRGAQEKFT
jgi:hypothetical protein